MTGNKTNQNSLRRNRKRKVESHAEPVAIGEVILALMKKLGIENEHWVDVLAREWSSLVGPAVADHTKPGRIEKQTLVVFVDSSAWLSELTRYGQSKMLENLRKRFGQARIRSVRLQLDPG